MNKPTLPTPETLRKLLRYDPETGKMFWLPRTPDMFSGNDWESERSCKSWNSKNSEKVAFRVARKDGYLQGKIARVSYLSHRVAWAIDRGAWPDSDIDHINGDRSDNRIVNLREATDTENGRNRGKNKNNRSGYKGVSKFKNEKRWGARICENGNKHYLGSFHTPEAAYAAYCEAAKRLHGEFARVV